LNLKFQTEIEHFDRQYNVIAQNLMHERIGFVFILYRKSENMNIGYVWLLVYYNRMNMLSRWLKSILEVTKSSYTMEKKLDMTNFS
jgi:hypothetical protein